MIFIFFFFFSSRRRHTRLTCDWSSDVCSSDLVVWSDAESVAWSGFLGVGDATLGGLPRASLRRLRHVRTPADRRSFSNWVTNAIAPRNVCGLANAAAHYHYPVDLDLLVARHGVLGMSRESLINALPALRGGAKA